MGTLHIRRLPFHLKWANITGPVGWICVTLKLICYENSEGQQYLHTRHDKRCGWLYTQPAATLHLLTIFGLYYHLFGHQWVQSLEYVHILDFRWFVFWQHVWHLTEGTLSEYIQVFPWYLKLRDLEGIPILSQITNSRCLHINIH